MKALILRFSFQLVSGTAVVLIGYEHSTPIATASHHYWPCLFILLAFYLVAQIVEFFYLLLHLPLKLAHEARKLRLGLDILVILVTFHQCIYHSGSYYMPHNGELVACLIETFLLLLTHFLVTVLAVFNMKILKN